MDVCRRNVSNCITTNINLIEKWSGRKVYGIQNRGTILKGYPIAFFPFLCCVTLTNPLQFNYIVSKSYYYMNIKSIFNVIIGNRIIGNGCLNIVPVVSPIYVHMQKSALRYCIHEWSQNWFKMVKKIYYARWHAYKHNGL